MAFIVAAPVLDPVLFGALVLIVGLEVAVAYLAVAFTAALGLALVAQRIGIEQHLKPLPMAQYRTPVAVGRSAPELLPLGDGKGCDTQSSGSQPPWEGPRREAVYAGRSAVVLFRSFGPLLALGVAVGLAIEVFVSPETAARITGDGSMFAIPIAAALGTPLYFSTELFIPIADALDNAGVGTGAIVAFTIAGAGANVPEFIILTRLARRRLVAILFLYVFAIAMAGGYLAHIISQ